MFKETGQVKTNLLRLASKDLNVGRWICSKKVCSTIKKQLFPQLKQTP